MDNLISIPPKNKPKVLFILPALEIGGAETKTFNLLHSLQSFDRVLVTHSSIQDYYSGLDIKIYAFENFKCVYPHILSPNNIFTYAKSIKNIAHYENPEIILGIMHFGALFVIAAHDIFFLKAHPVITIEGNFSAYFESINRPPSLKEKLLIRYCFSRAKGIIVPSEGVKRDLVGNYGASGKKVKTIYNGIDIKKVTGSSQDEIPCKKDCSWIVTACRLNTQKDFSTLLRAFRIVRENIISKLFIIGEGELKEDIKKLSVELNIDKDVIMTGFHENPFAYISRGDVFVLSSFYEGFGNVIVEAMALGIPVVSTDCPSGPGEIITDGENGFLVPVGDFKEMAVKCLLLLNNSDIKKSVSRNGQKRAADFSIHVMAKEFENCMTELLMG